MNGLPIDLPASLAALFEAKLTLDREKANLVRMQKELKGFRQGVAALEGAAGAAGAGGAGTGAAGTVPAVGQGVNGRNSPASIRTSGAKGVMGPTPPPMPAPRQPLPGAPAAASRPAAASGSGTGSIEKYTNGWGSVYPGTKGKEVAQEECTCGRV